MKKRSPGDGTYYSPSKFSHESIISIQIMQTSFVGSPPMFLHKRFPNWKEDHKTHMVPSNCTDLDGDGIIYDLLKQLGEQENIGMFVIHGFELKDIPKLNKECRSRNYLMPTILPKSGESNFIIFHHTLGILSLEVKNYLKIEDGVLLDAENELKTSHDLITELAAFERSEDFNIPYRKIVAMPSTKKSDFSRSDFPSLKADTLLLFESDSLGIEPFKKWWQETIEKPTALLLTEQAQHAYEQVLSYVLMIRHLGPVTDSDFMAHFLQSLVSSKYDFQWIKDQYPKFWSWVWDVLGKKDEGFDFGEGKAEKMREEFARKHKLNFEDLTSVKLMAVINELLENVHKNYISGDTASMIDYAMAIVFEDTKVFLFRHILLFISKMWQEQTQVTELKHEDRSTLLNEYPYLQPTSLEDLRKLNQHLQFSFIKGDTPTELDQELFKTLTCQTRMKHSRLPMVMTSEQLNVFEGPLKQLIIAPPGGGKTEIMKFKALELEFEMKICKEEKKILYIIANGDVDYSNTDSLLYYHIREFFKASTLVEVISIILEEEEEEALNRTISILTEKMASGMYGHVFVDEYWVGSKPKEHEIMKKLITGIPGYVWISSVHEYNEDPKYQQKMAQRTEPLIKELTESNGVVSRMTQVLRATNAIIDVERDYSGKSRHRAYPFGTELIRGHSFEGLPVTWAVEDDVDGMYAKCADIVESALGISSVTVDGEKLVLYPDDILIVDFAIRTNESLHVKQSLKKHLSDKRIPIWSFGESLEQFTDCGVGNVTLMESRVREASCYLDGVEWPMVVVILPSKLLMNEADLASGAQKLRNYDLYISLFRAMVKLVVISDKWSKKEDFITDAGRKFKK